MDGWTVLTGFVTALISLATAVVRHLDARGGPSRNKKDEDR